MTEFSRTYDPRQLPGSEVQIAADTAERAALAKRFDLVRIDRLEARIVLERADLGALANGTMDAAWVQSCAVSGEDLPITVREPIRLHFVPASPTGTPAEEIELAADELDEIVYEGSLFDLGEALAQSLALAIDPYAVGPDAEEARRKAGLLDQASSGPFAALAALKQKN